MVFTVTCKLCLYHNMYITHFIIRNIYIYIAWTIYHTYNLYKSSSDDFKVI